MAKWYFTFPCGIDKPHRNGYHVIETPSSIVARELMIERFGMEWAFQYSEEEFEGQIEEYHLHEVE
jgi:hypothetical protein